jgi:hypothetical protein
MGSFGGVADESGEEVTSVLGEFHPRGLDIFTRLERMRITSWYVEGKGINLVLKGRALEAELAGTPGERNFS